MSGQVEIAGRYLRRGTLGTGAGTVVYEAFDRLIERRVAIKVVTLPPVDDPETAEAIARFRRGARAAGGLNHANIAAVFDYGESAEEAWIVMELVEGGSLKSLLDSGERPPLARVVQIMVQLLEGLGYSHAKGVVHRDIKPANIMLTPAGTVKLADFGIARLENSSMTHVGTMIGTPAYMAPEQLRGEVVDQRANIWAAGVVLYQMLTGEKPFGGGITAIMQKALHTEPVPPSQLRPETGLADFDRVVARAMAKAPADRFASAAEFAAALQGAAEPKALGAVVTKALGAAEPKALGAAEPKGLGAAKPPGPDHAPTLPKYPYPTPDDGTVLRAPPTRLLRPPPKSRKPLVLAGVAALLLVGAGVAVLSSRPPAMPEVQAMTAPRAEPPMPTPPVPTPPVLAPLPATSVPMPASPAPAKPGPATPGPATPAPATPVLAPPAPPPEPDLSTVAAVVQALPCSLLQVSLPGRVLSVTGLARGAEADAMQRGIEAFGVPVAAQRLLVDRFGANFCGTLDIIRPAAALGEEAPTISFTSPNPLRGGQALRFVVTQPPWAARLHVAYVTEAGEVGHLVQAGAPLAAGASLALGEAGRWTATAPFGSDLLIIVASEQPLFAQRRRNERLAEFNPALQAALREAQSAGRVAVRAAVLHTVAGP